MQVYSVIMAGGAGTRFWPRSRKDFPKQLLNIFGEETLIQSCYNRMLHFSEQENILIVTNNSLKKHIQEQLPQCTDQNFVLEPFGRNTAPCIALTALEIAKTDPEGVMVVVPADHLIEEVHKFNNVIQAGIEFAKENNSLVTIGIQPTHPETGYGYIQSGEFIEKKANKPVYRVKTFAEKPDLETAKRFLESGDFYWNSGMFIWRVDVILKAIQTYLPDIHDELNKVMQNRDSDDFFQRLELAYKKIRGISIDYGVMQEADNVYVIPGDFIWNDVGSWDVVAKLKAKNRNDNVIEAIGNVTINSKNNYVHSSEKVVALIDVDNLIIINTEDALMVCKKGSSQKVRNVVDELKLNGLSKYI